MVEEMVKLRKGKMTAEDCAAALKKSNYFGTMLVKMGKGGRPAGRRHLLHGGQPCAPRCSWSRPSPARTW